MTLKSIYLVMRRRYDEDCYHPKMAYNNKEEALSTCISLTRSNELYSYSVLDIPLGYSVEVDE